MTIQIVFFCFVLLVLLFYFVRIFFNLLKIQRVAKVEHRISFGKHWIPRFHSWEMELAAGSRFPKRKQIFFHLSHPVQTKVFCLSANQNLWNLSGSLMMNIIRVRTRKTWKFSPKEAGSTKWLQKKLISIWTLQEKTVSTLWVVGKIYMISFHFYDS